MLVQRKLKGRRSQHRTESELDTMQGYIRLQCGSGVIRWWTGFWMKNQEVFWWNQTKYLNLTVAQYPLCRSSKWRIMHPISVFVFHILIKIDMAQLIFLWNLFHICSLIYGCKLSLIRPNVHHQWKKSFHSLGASNTVKLICGLKKTSLFYFWKDILQWLSVSCPQLWLTPVTSLISPWRQAFFQPAGLAIIEVPSPPRVQHVLMKGAEQNEGHSSVFLETFRSCREWVQVHIWACKYTKPIIRPRELAPPAFLKGCSKC